MSNIELAQIVEFGWKNKEACLGLLAIGFAFTLNQRRAIKNRDHNRCQATAPHQHDTEHPLEVDHILPQAYGRHMGLDDSYIDAPENGLTKCRNAHDIKHPERIEIRRNYFHKKQDPNYNMGKELGDIARGKMQAGEIYWNDANDRADHVRAMQLTQKAKRRGWFFPSRQKRGD